VDRRQVECEPIRTLGEHKCTVRLTVDLTPDVKIIVHREGETPAVLVQQQAAAEAAVAAEAAAKAETAPEETSAPATEEVE
jgi:large subunit ribosomal protein L9